MLWMASRSIVPRRSGRASEFVRPPLPGQGLAPSRTLAGPMPFALCSRSRGVFAIGLLAALAPATAGCMVFQRISGSDTVDLSRARISTMNVEVRRESKTICPREPVQMAVFLTATKEGETKEQLFETWAGRTNVNKNDKLDFSQFAFQSEQGQFDKDGWFTPTPNLVATTGHEFLIRATFTPQPVVLSSVYKFRPDYACILAAGTSGLAGTVGGSGVAGTPGKPGSFGGVMSAGDAGGDGSSGMPGADGGNGGVGPHVHAVVTYVKTPFYDRLIAVRVTGTVDDLLLIHPGRPFVLRALGGEGGPGGLGGAGGAGGMGAGGNPGGPGGNAGRGGNGGRGGPGGPGGRPRPRVRRPLPGPGERHPAGRLGGRWWSRRAAGARRRARSRGRRPRPRQHADRSARGAQGARSAPRRARRRRSRRTSRHGHGAPRAHRHRVQRAGRRGRPVGGSRRSRRGTCTLTLH